MIPFNKPPQTGLELEYIQKAISNDKLCGDGHFGRACQTWFEEKFLCKKALMTPSCTHALELAAMLIDIQPGDEIIMPSYTFVSTANAFVLRGASIRFVDIDPDTMNIDASLIEPAITPKTRAIVPVHYAGVSCDMESIMQLAARYSLYVIEDAAQGVMSEYKGKPLGTIGHLGAFSFHETKNYSSGGEGGLLLINDEAFIERAEIIREKGTNRSKFFRGAVDKYSWVDIGSSLLPSELQSAYLLAQLQQADRINNNRLRTWNRYFELLSPLANQGKLDLPIIPEDCKHNAHMFYIKLRDIAHRSSLIQYLRDREVATAFHYVPLHSSEAGKEFSNFIGDDRFTTSESERLLRLPLWYGLESECVDKICQHITEFFN